MRRAILQKFILVLFGALILNGLIFYLVGSRVILNSSTRDMLYMLEVLDGSLDYESDLEKTMKKLDSVMDGNNSRLTVIDLDGTVVADTQAQMDEMDNHLDREEIQDALEKGSGYARRRSDTLDEGMLYVAYRSRNADVILRAAVPYSGFQQYLPLFFPASVLSLLIAVVGSFIVTTRLVSSITKPLQDIAKEMLKVKGDYTELNFEHCQYPEINVIADTTMKMSKNVKDYLNQIEKERMIRQEFFSNASHELKTPVTALNAILENMILGIGKYKDRDRCLLECKEITGQLSFMIKEILDTSRLDFIQEKQDAETFELSERLPAICEPYQLIAKAKGLDFSFSIQGKCPVHTSKKGLEKILSNLLSNAVSYTKPGCKITVLLTARQIKIENECTPIPPDKLAHVFEPFYRPDFARDRKDGGNGLGLYIVDTLSKALGLPYQFVATEDPPGMCFTLSLKRSE